MSRVRMMSDEELETYSDIMAPTKERLGFVPNSQRIMAHKPELVVAYNELGKAVMLQTDKSIPPDLKYMIANASSLAAGCNYCQAHTAGASNLRGVEGDKVAAIFMFETSDLFTEDERAALRFAQAASSVPNMVTEEDFEGLRKHFTEYQIVEIVSVVSMFGFLNRWNDTLATPLEAEPIEFAEQYLADNGWDVGKHVNTEAAE
ncbi:MAG: peroxidase-related enzyme [Pseudomonadota bacterium]|nr:peroxidase-related enzyme [Pseudomonadota bacterium]